LKDNDVKHEFIKLRAQGVSFDKISNELQVSKQTLINWQSEFIDEIANLKAIELESLYEQFYLQKKDRIERLGKLLDKIHNEIEKRDLTELETDKLISLYLKVFDKTKDELTPVRFSTEDEISSFKFQRENDKKWSKKLNDLQADLMRDYEKI